MERVLGIGGIFVRAKDPVALAQWYQEHLGVPVGPGETYGVLVSHGAGEQTVWSAFAESSDYFGRAEQRWMINFRVRDLDAMLAQLRNAGVPVDDRIEEEFGRFGWATDPEGNRIELWEPPA